MDRIEMKKYNILYNIKIKIAFVESIIAFFEKAIGAKVLSYRLDAIPVRRMHFIQQHRKRTWNE